MIISAYGCPGITCVELALMFNNLKINYGLVRRQRLTKVLDNNREDQPIFPAVFNSVSMFLRTYGKFKPSTKVVAFIIDSPVVLTQNLGLPLVGAEVSKYSAIFSKITEESLKEVLLACTPLDTPLTFANQRYKPVDEILKRYEQSDLSKLQTFLYKIKEQDTRDRVSKLTKSWLLTSSPFSSIEGKLHKDLSPNVANTLQTMLTLPSVANLRKAIRKVKTNKLSAVKASKIYKVSAFDLRFLLADRGKPK
jgi:hypothetical protein